MLRPDVLRSESYFRGYDAWLGVLFISHSDDGKEGAANVLSGLSGNDTIVAGAGDTVDGGDGTDLIMLDFKRAGTTATVASGVCTLRNGTATVTVSNTEFVRFMGETTSTAIAALLPVSDTVTYTLSATEISYTGTDATKKYVVTGNARQHADRKRTRGYAQGRRWQRHAVRRWRQRQANRKRRE